MINQEEATADQTEESTKELLNDILNTQQQ